jgi:TPR repeat protein
MRTRPRSQPGIVHEHQQDHAHEIEPMSAVEKRSPARARAWAAVRRAATDARGRIGLRAGGGIAGAGLAALLAGCAAPSQEGALATPVAAPAPHPVAMVFDDDRLRLDVFNVYHRAPAADILPVTVPPPVAAATPRLAQAYASLPPDALFDRALGFEEQHKYAQAVALHRLASQRGYAPSSRRLMELYADGAPGVARDYRAAVYYKHLAVRQGDSLDTTWRR